MNMEDDVLKDFYLLCNYLKKEGKIADLNRYKEDFSAFLLHADHIKIYDFISPFCKNKKVLDIGCFIGYGETRILAAKEIVAIDSDDKVLEFARQNRKLPNVKFLRMDARKLTFSNEVFDVIISFHLIEHIQPNEVGIFLDGVKRLLKKEGLFFIVTPNSKFRLLPFQKPFNPEHYQEFTAKRFLKTLRKTFKDIQIKGTRAKDWIEEIERRRVRRSSYQVYIFHPLYKFLNIIFPENIKNYIKKGLKTKILYKYKNKKVLESNNQFHNLLQKFSMDDFYIEKHNIDKSMNLFAICKK